MTVTPDNAALIVAESYANRLTAFDIAAIGGLSNRRVWAEAGDEHPDGICLDAEDVVWYADVDTKRCVRVREGGEVLQTIELDRGCFACMLGALEGRTPFILAAVYDPASMPIGERTGQAGVLDSRRTWPPLSRSSSLWKVLRTDKKGTDSTEWTGDVCSLLEPGALKESAPSVHQ